MRGFFFALGLICIIVPSVFLLLDWLEIKIINDYITSIIISQAITAYMVAALIFAGMFMIDKLR